MLDEQELLLTLPADAVPEQLCDWFAALGQTALVASLELLPDGRLVVQTLPGIDPRFVARVRQILAQHADVLRRLT